MIIEVNTLIITKKEKNLKETTDRRTYHIIRCVDQDPWTEDYGHIKRRNKGYRGYWKSKEIWQHQVRMYRTWKHHRKTQWKLK